MRKSNFDGVDAGAAVETSRNEVLVEFACYEVGPNSLTNLEWDIPAFASGRDTALGIEIEKGVLHLLDEGAEVQCSYKVV